MSSRKRRGRGEGSIFERTDGMWVASVSAGYTGDGKRRRRTIYGKSKQAVQEKLRQLQLSEMPGDTARLTVADFITRWEGSAAASVAPTTMHRYSMVLRRHVVPYIGQVQLSKLSPFHVEQLFLDQARKGVSDRNRQMSGTVLHTALEHAIRLKILTSNPCGSVEKPRPTKREMEVWDAEQVKKFLAAASQDRLHALYVMALTTGMRQGELFALQWSNIDFDSGAVMVQRTLEELKGKLRVKETKTAKGRRRIDLPRFVVDVLHEHRKRMLAEGRTAAPVFCDGEGGYLRKSNFARRSYAPLLKAAGVPVIRFHDLRHTNASLLLLQGEHPKVVSERLGHASIEITLDVYSHALPTLQKAAADKLDRLFG